MWSVVIMSGTAYAMRSVDTLDELEYDSGECDRCEVHISQGDPVIFCQDIDDIRAWFAGKIEIIKSRDEEDEDDESDDDE